MSQTQTRKQKILGDVKRKRRQRTAMTFTIVAVLIAIVILALILYRPPIDLVPLPDYLSHCVGPTLVYHSHPNLTITISGVNFALTPATGTFINSCPQPIHTHDISGVLHVETDVNRDYTLGDWFLLWGHSEQNPTRAIFNSTQIFDHKVTPGHSLNMTVNGVTITGPTGFQNHVFPRNASPTGGTGGTPGSLCEAPAGQPCVQDNIVITYT
jgi:hypothetical protein